MIKAVAAKHPNDADVKWMCETAGVSRSGYYSWLKASAAPGDPSGLRDVELVRWAYEYRNRPKGSRTISMLLRLKLGVVMNRKKVRRIMRENGMACPIRKANPLRKAAKAMRTHSVFSNKLNRQFSTGFAGEHILTDITYVRYGQGGRCYLSAAKDASTNEIIAWRLSETIDLPFVIAMVDDVIAIDWLPEHCLIHSDQGCHYTSREYQRKLREALITQSMSRRGNCWDNAPMESFFGHAKDELRLGSCKTFAQVRDEISDYIDYYNNDRPQEGLGGLSPALYREKLLSRPKMLPVPVTGGIGSPASAP